MRRLIAPPGPLNAPKPIRVQASVRRRPIVVAGKPVKTVNNDWLQEDGWWRKSELRRRYWTVNTINGRRVVVFRDLETGRWFTQRT
jgi:hypothetical protein